MNKTCALRTGALSQITKRQSLSGNHV